MAYPTLSSIPSNGPRRPPVYKDKSFQPALLCWLLTNRYLPVQKLFLYCSLKYCPGLLMLSQEGNSKAGSPDQRGLGSCWICRGKAVHWQKASRLRALTSEELERSLHGRLIVIKQGAPWHRKPNPDSKCLQQSKGLLQDAKHGSGRQASDRSHLIFELGVFLLKRETKRLGLITVAFL